MQIVACVQFFVGLNKNAMKLFYTRIFMKPPSLESYYFPIHARKAHPQRPTAWNRYHASGPSPLSSYRKLPNVLGINKIPPCRTKYKHIILSKILEPMIESHPRHFNRVGQIVVGTFGFCGIATLCYYGIHKSNVAATEGSSVWEDFIRERIKKTYLYFGAAVLITGSTAISTIRAPNLIRVIGKTTRRVFTISFIAQVVSGVIVLNMDYYPDRYFSMKPLVWIIHSVLMGVTIGPMCHLWGPILARGFLLSGGVVLGLSAIAYCSPEGRFLSWGGPLGMCLGGLVASTVGTFFLPPRVANYGATLYAFYLYLGLLLFSAFLLYDTQELIYEAEVTPHTQPDPFDPINGAMSLYMDSFNIFVCFVQEVAVEKLKEMQKQEK